MPAIWDAACLRMASELPPAVQWRSQGGGVVPLAVSRGPGSGRYTLRQLLTIDQAQQLLQPAALLLRNGHRCPGLSA